DQPGARVRPNVRVLALEKPEAATASGVPLDAVESNKALVEEALKAAAPDEMIIVLCYGPPPRGPESARLAADRRVKMLIVGLRGEAAPDEPWREVPIVEVPSLTRSAAYVVVTIDGPRAIVTVRAPNTPLPLSEVVRPLRK